MNSAARREWELYNQDDWVFYIPQFIWRFWVDACPTESRPWSTSAPYGLHVYDVETDTISVGCAERLPSHLPCGAVFHHIVRASPGIETHPTWHAVHAAFETLEGDAETAIRSLLQQAYTRGASTGRATSINEHERGRQRLALPRHSFRALQRYLLFLRFRNSSDFSAVLETAGCECARAHSGTCSCAEAHARWLRLLAGFCEFLRGEVSNPDTGDVYLSCDVESAEISVGLADEADEYILTSSCHGIVEEDGAGNLEKSLGISYFFTITPRFTLYILLDVAPFPTRTHLPLRPPANTSPLCAEEIDFDLEASTDIYQRNALLLQTYPCYVIYASERSMIRTIRYYDERRWLPENLDYSKLLRGCRQESVTHTLQVKASIEVVDLTDDVVRLGDGAVAHGAFADVWQGLWTERQGQGKKLVALKVLRTIMMQNVQETLLKRLKDEVLAWHRLEHPHIARLHGIIQLPSTLAMVSPWCENGTIVKYLREKNPSADRLQLMLQIASGVHYLHTRTPAVVHGDLKGGNILIDSAGAAIITDFGLARVMEQVSDVTRLETSFFAGSTRWMAPELILALVEDDEQERLAPPLSTHSDVYAFASVCLEVLTDELPYAHRRNDHAVTIDVMRGVKPSRGTGCKVNGVALDSLWARLDRCWDQFPRSRPDMSEMVECLAHLMASKPGSETDQEVR